MANEEKDVLQANEGAPAANIPDLKKKEKERKKAGAAWSGARGAASEFSGATGGTVARAAASAAAEGAMVGAEGLEGGGLWAALSRFLAGLTGTLLGKMALAAAAFLMVAGAGLLGYNMMKGKGDGATGAPDLGGISDSMRVRAGGDDRMGVNGKGEIAFDPQSASKPAAPAAPVGAKAADAPPAEAPKADADADKPVPSGQLAHNLSGAKLSSSLGGDFGNKNIFSGNSAAPKFGAGLSGLSKIGGAKGQLSSGRSNSARASASGSSNRRGFANKAFGQALLAKGLSQQGTQSATGEGAASSAQGAFDQQQPTGGGLNTIGAPGGDTPAAMGGGGAPDTTLPNAPSDPTGTGTDPGLQNSLGQISSLANQAMSNIQTGTILTVLAAALIATGVGLLASMFSIPAGIALIAAGTALLIVGLMKIASGRAEAAQAIQMGQQLGQSIGDVQQANAINYCTNNAVTTGTPVESCTPPESVTNSTAQDATNTTDVNRVKAIPVVQVGISPQK